MIPPGRHLHFIGVGGIGMSGLAQLCAGAGYGVSGCDAKSGELLQELRARGLDVSVGHHANHMSPSVDLVVYSAAVPPHEPELIEAKRRGIPTITRGQLLSELAATKRLIAVAGAHGKTTTSGMAAQLLMEAGWDPTSIVGGIMRSFGSNVRAGRGRYLVAETDESDGSFLLLHPEAAIVTNVDREHLNHYGTFNRLIAAFRQFVEQLGAGGTLIRCADDPLVRKLLSHSRQLSYGLDASAGAELIADRIAVRKGWTTFRARFRDCSLGAFALGVSGRHNVLNALGVVGLGLTLDLPLTTIREALASFQGTERRFQMFRLPGDILLVEDYAHHPSEIHATLATDPESPSHRHRLVVFQPHRFTRTRVLESEFSACFNRADGVIVTDVYAASEEPIPGVSGERLAGLIKAQGLPWVRYVPREQLASHIRSIAHSGDTIFFLGAGDIGELCHDVANSLHSAARAAR